MTGETHWYGRNLVEALPSVMYMSCRVAQGGTWGTRLELLLLFYTKQIEEKEKKRKTWAR